MRKLTTLLAFVGGFLTVAALIRRLGGVGRRERVDLYYEDGSMVALVDGSPESARLLTLARDAIRSVPA
jgi:hypothetical protein